ncbi:MAG: ThuA domain-containing protein [Planctomycetaceae bacterium]
MPIHRRSHTPVVAVFLILQSLLPSTTEAVASSADEPSQTRIILVAGETAKVDKPGHHDYLAGCDCLALLLRQTPGVVTVRINDGWPQDESLFDGAAAIVFYTDGGGKQAFLKTPNRIARMQALVDAGVGIVMIHQAVDFPDDHLSQAKTWIGGVYAKGKSGRGHWDSAHVDFPKHEVCRGVTAWQINDGWLNGLQFVQDMKGITPLVWSGREYTESRTGIDAHIVAWTYDRPNGGRSFSFTGLDAHSAWERTGMRQLVINGILWSAGVMIPDTGAPSTIEQSQLDGLLTPRQPAKTDARKSIPKKKASAEAVETR